MSADTQPVTCETCKGHGTTDGRTACKRCLGYGLIMSTQKVDPLR